MVKTVKIFALLFAMTMTVFSLSACNDELKIENYEWRLSTVQSSANGRVVAYSATSLFGGAVAYPDAPTVEMSLVAKDGRITITDETNNKTYDGTYSLDAITPDSRNYIITVDGEQGYAGVAMTTYADGSKTPTLPITLGEYSLYFYAD